MGLYLESRGWGRRIDRSRIAALVCAVLLVGVTACQLTSPGDPSPDKTPQVAVSDGPNRSPRLPEDGGPGLSEVDAVYLLGAALSRREGVALYFHPEAAPVSLMVRGQGRYRACPTADGGYTSGETSSGSSWGRVWGPEDCIEFQAGTLTALPIPPSFHLGVSVRSATDALSDAKSIELRYSPSDNFLIYGLDRVRAGRPTIVGRASMASGVVGILVVGMCSADLVLAVSGVAAGTPSGNVCEGELRERIAGVAGQKVEVGAGRFADISDVRLAVSWPS